MEALAAITIVLQPEGVSSYLMIVAALGTTAIVALVRPVRSALNLQPMEAIRLD